MKIAILADIHANFVALQTVAAHVDRWQPDAVVVAGDIVNRGPRPRECLEFVLQKQQTAGWLAVKGNHEDYVISCAPPNGAQSEIWRIADWTYEQLNGDVAALQALPFQVDLPLPGGSELRVVHASMLGNRNGIYRHTTDEHLRQKIAPPPAVFCAGHTHIPLRRTIDQTLVVNAGSVGLPFDGDQRAGYAQIELGQSRRTARIVRLKYDYCRAEQDFYATGFWPGGGPLAKLVLDELRTAQSRLYQWTTEYQQATIAGEISLEAAVNNFLVKVKSQ